MGGVERKSRADDAVVVGVVALVGGVIAAAVLFEQSLAGRIEP
ncbi:MAG: hypothetical protein AB8G14_13860 [Ilumatobacter sp.]